jgi:adenylyltransferase/sulfurtransferase
MSGELSRAVLDEIYAHARAGYPEEICGLIIAENEVRRCENRQNALHAEDPEHFPRDARTAYNLAPKDLLFLGRSLGGARPVTAIYHSHVDVGAYFSDEDVRAALNDGELLYPVDYVVIDVRKEGVRGCRRFRFTDGKFVEIASDGP